MPSTRKTFIKQGDKAIKTRAGETMPSTNQNLQGDNAVNPNRGDNAINQREIYQAGRQSHQPEPRRQCRQPA
jgi:hypothetical protein